MRRSGLLGIFCGVALLAGSAGAAPPPLRMAVTDISGLEMLQAEFGKFRDVLARATGKEVAFYPVSSRTAAVEDRLSWSGVARAGAREERGRWRFAARVAGSFAMASPGSASRC